MKKAKGESKARLDELYPDNFIHNIMADLKEKKRFLFLYDNNLLILLFEKSNVSNNFISFTFLEKKSSFMLLQDITKTSA